MYICKRKRPNRKTRFVEILYPLGIFRFGKKLYYWCFCVKKFPDQLFCGTFPDGCLWWRFHIFMHNAVYSTNIQVSWGQLTIVKETKWGDRRVAWVLSNNDWSSTKYWGKWRSDCQGSAKVLLTHCWRKSESKIASAIFCPSSTDLNFKDGAHRSSLWRFFYCWCL